MPADLATFMLGGGVGSKIVAKTAGGALKKEMSKKLTQGYVHQGFKKTAAKELADSKTNAYLRAPSVFMNKNKHRWVEDFVDINGKIKSVRLFNGKDTAYKYFLNSAKMAGELGAYGAGRKAVDLHMNRGEMTETGEWQPGYLQASDIGPIMLEGMKEAVVGGTVGGIKAAFGAVDVTRLSTNRKHLLKAGELLSETAAFGTIHPLINLKTPTLDDYKHAAFAVGTLNIFNKTMNKVSQFNVKRKDENARRVNELSDEIVALNKIAKKTSNKNLKNNINQQTDRNKQKIIDKQFENEINDYPILNKIFTKFSKYSNKLKALK